MIHYPHHRTVPAVLIRLGLAPAEHTAYGQGSSVRYSGMGISRTSTGDVSVHLFPKIAHLLLARDTSTKSSNEAGTDRHFSVSRSHPVVCLILLLSVLALPIKLEAQNPEIDILQGGAPIASGGIKELGTLSPGSSADLPICRPPSRTPERLPLLCPALPRTGAEKRGLERTSNSLVPANGRVRWVVTNSPFQAVSGHKCDQIDPDQ